MSKSSFNCLIVSSILFGIALLPVTSNALDFTLEPRLQAGVMDYAFEQKPASYKNAGGGSTTNKGLKLVSIMPFVGGGVTLFADRFFVDFYIQKAFSASDTATNPYESDKGSEWDIIVDSEFDRDEYSVSVGYAIGSQWVFFGGYREAKTNFTDSLVIPEGTFIIEGETTKLFASGKRSLAFKQDGLFVGGAYVLNITEHSVVTLNAALAVLDGKYNSGGDLELQHPNLQETFPVSLGDDNDGDAVGLNLGAAWKGRIAKSLGYTLGVNGYSYDFDAKDSGADVSESALRFSAGLSYQF